MKKKKVSASFLSVVLAFSLFGMSFSNSGLNAFANESSNENETVEVVDQGSNESSEKSISEEKSTETEKQSSDEASSSNENTVVAGDATEPEGDTTTTESNESTTSIYFTDDVHGNFENAKQDSGMCYATVKALKDKANTGENKAYAVDAGDDVQGNAYVNYDSGENVSEILSAVGYDFRVPGNHEFDYGMDRFINFFNKNNDYYSCNFYNGTPTNRGDNVLSSYKIVGGANNQKIAFIGIMTPETIMTSAPAYFKDKDGNWIKYIDDNSTSEKKIYDVFNASIQEAKQAASKQGGDVVCIGVGHLGDEPPTKAAGLDAETVVSKSKGLTAFIDAHSHNPYEKDVTDSEAKTVKIAQAASGIKAHSREEKSGINRIGKFSIDAAGSVSYTQLTAESQEVKDAGRDEDVLKKEKETIDFVDQELGKVVSHNNDIDTSISKTKLRCETNNVADMVTDSIFWYTNTNNADDGTYGADASFINGGGINHKAGSGTAFVKYSDITLKNCNSLLRGNYLGTAEMTGYTLREALEFSVRTFGSEDNSGFLQTGGLKYYLNTGIESTVQVKGEGDRVFYAGPPTGQYRVTGIQIFDKEKNAFVDLDLNKTYKIASIVYLLDKRGNGYTMFKDLKVHYYTSKGSDYQALGEYFENFTTQQNVKLLASNGSPIHNNMNLTNYPINYENPKGVENKIIPGVAPEPDPPTPTPEPTPTPTADSEATSSGTYTGTSTQTSDNSVATFAIFMVVLASACGVAAVSKRKELQSR